MPFADDHQYIFYSHSDPNRLQSALNDELRNFDVWLKCNKLSVNPLKKTITLSLNLDNDFTLFFGDQFLNQPKLTKFLVVYVDEHLTWKHHISFIYKQISKSVDIIFRSRFYLSSNTKLTLYYALIYPYITFYNSTWSPTYVSNLNRIFYLLKSGLCEPLPIQIIEYTLLPYLLNCVS